MKKCLIILVCGLLYSCVSTRKVQNQSLEVAKFDTAKFNGNYANYAGTGYNKGLFEKLCTEVPFSNATGDSILINFNFENKNTLVITTVNNGKIMQTKKLKGRIKNNYFSVRRKLFLIPFPFIVYSHDETKILLGNDKNGNLILKLGHHSVFWVFIMAAGESYVSQYQYKKIN